MKSIRVFVIENSAVMQQNLIEIIEQDQRLEIAGVANDIERALRNLPRARADVIALGTWFPRTDVVKVTKRLMTNYPLPIVLVPSSEKEKLNESTILDALKAGALTIAQCFSGFPHESPESSVKQLCSQLVNMSQVKVIRFRPLLLSKEPPKLPNLNLDGKRMIAPGLRRDQKFEVIGIVASAGGPQALLKVLNDLPCDLPTSILVVQHMTPSFMNGFVAWLDANCSLPVMLAQKEQVPIAGTVYVASPGVHLQIAYGALKFHAGDPVDGHCPSGSVLFQSMADSVGEKGLGILLTGMGKDGAAGLCALRKAGGYTIAEDASTAVIYGMPGAACQLNGVCASIPLHQIGSTIEWLCKYSKKRVNA